MGYFIHLGIRIKSKGHVKHSLWFVRLNKHVEGSEERENDNNKYYALYTVKQCSRVVPSDCLPSDKTHLTARELYEENEEFVRDKVSTESLHWARKSGTLRLTHSVGRRQAQIHFCCSISVRRTERHRSCWCLKGNVLLSDCMVWCWAAHACLVSTWLTRWVELTASALLKPRPG